MTKIALEQNTGESIKLLIAQARLYTEAKRILLLRLVVAAILAIIAPIVAIVFPAVAVYMAVLGAIWYVVTYLPFRGVQREKTLQAATIQEQFDTHLFNLPWNEVLVEQPVPPELISAAARRSKEDPSRFRNWYSDTGSLPYPRDVLLCQRQNAVWDWRLQNQYAAMVAGIGVSVLAIDIIVGLILNQHLSTFLLSLFIPTLPVLTLTAETALAHREMAKDKKETATQIDTIWQEQDRSPELVTQERCRQIQNRLFIQRRDGSFVLDVWYRFLRPGYQPDADSAVERLRRQAEPNGRE